MTESQDHRPPWRVSDLELTALAGVIEKFAGPAKEYSSQVAYLQSMSVLDLRDARARIEELEEQLALGARMEAHLAEKLDHADTALLKAMDRIKELEAALDASIALRKEAEEQFAVAAEANVRTEARIKELEAKLSRQAPVIEAARRLKRGWDDGSFSGMFVAAIVGAVCKLDGR